MRSTHIAVAGGGVIGLNLALELRRRGADVTVVSRDYPGSAEKHGAATWAAAGMLAEADPAHPASLQPLASHSAKLYPALLNTLNRTQAETQVSFETVRAWEEASTSGAMSLPLPANPALRFQSIEEFSIDPRGLWRALLAACNHSGVTMVEGTVTAVHEHDFQVEVQYSGGKLHASAWINCAGAWATQIDGCELSPDAVVPRKGQMLRLENNCGLKDVVRSGHIYAVPRGDGTLLAGATVEDAGFEAAVIPETSHWLRRRAAHLLPALADSRQIDAWTGFRPSTPDGLPLLGRVSERGWVATGHGRNGILLAPATALVMADVVEGKTPLLAVEAFAPARFAPARM